MEHYPDMKRFNSTFLKWLDGALGPQGKGYAQRRRTIADSAAQQRGSYRMDSELESALSHERFARYREWAEENRDRALALCALNTQVSESLYTPLQMLEVSLRNRIYSALSDAKHESWFEEDGFLEYIESARPSGHRTRPSGQIREEADARPHCRGTFLQFLDFDASPQLRRPLAENLESHRASQ